MPTLIDLPVEILDRVFSFLGQAPCSVRNIIREPRYVLAPRPYHKSSIKQVSLVSQYFRQLVLPHLFKHTWLALSLKLESSLHEGWCKKSSLTHGPEDEDQDEYPCCLAHHTSSLPPTLSQDIAALEQFLTTHGLLCCVSSFLISTWTDVSDAAYLTPSLSRSRTTGEARIPIFCDSNSLGALVWPQILSFVCPTQLTIVAPPSTLASLLNLPLRSTTTGCDAWAFDQPLHAVQLTQRAPTSSRASPPPHPASTSEILTSYSWTSLTLSEGSSMLAYSTDEYVRKVQPSIIEPLSRIHGPSHPTLHHIPDASAALVAADSHPDLPLSFLSRLRALTYIAIFPLACQQVALDFLLTPSNLPNLTTLTVRFQPDPMDIDNLFDQGARFARAEPRDPWMEIDDMYDSLMDNLEGLVLYTTSAEYFQTLDIYTGGVEKALPILGYVLQPDPPSQFASPRYLGGWQIEGMSTWKRSAVKWSE
ncbi:MAG: hypothetical protein M1819_005659 [Sarea resinae]|nr:MAG: hypothetical protein M1819_005659 [Sarea resinae]